MGWAACFCLMLLGQDAAPEPGGVRHSLAPGFPDASLTLPAEFTPVPTRQPLTFFFVRAGEEPWQNRYVRVYIQRFRYGKPPEEYSPEALARTAGIHTEYRLEVSTTLVPRDELVAAADVWFAEGEDQDTAMFGIVGAVRQERTVAILLVTGPENFEEELRSDAVRALSGLDLEAERWAPKGPLGVIVTFYVLYFGGTLVAFGGYVWCLVRVFMDGQTGWGCVGLLCWLPILIYCIIHFDRHWKALAVWGSGVVVVAVAMGILGLFGG